MAEEGSGERIIPVSIEEEIKECLGDKETH